MSDLRPSRKSCPHCGHEGPIDEDFGWRYCSWRQIPQSWCKKCRIERFRPAPVRHQEAP